jgi:acyl-CoA synthetase (AMP-forming)/AMP-acid ligase II
MYHLPAATIERYRTTGVYGDKTFSRLFETVVQRHPERLALVDAPNRASFLGGAPRRLSYSQAWAQAQGLAASMLAHGLQRNDVLCVQLPNCVELVLTYFACSMIGVVITPAPVQYREHELGHILSLTRARAIMTHCQQDDDAALARCVQLAHKHGTELVMAWHADGQALPDLQATSPHVPLMPAEMDGVALEALTAYQNSYPVNADETFTVCWTSGTEGLPKGVPRSHNQWQIAAKTVVESVDLQEGARLLNPFPLTNPGSLSGMVVPWLLTGGSLVLHQPFDLNVFLQQIRDEKIDYTCASPALLASLLQNETVAQNIDFKQLSRIASGGAPLSEWLVRGFAERFGVDIVNAYGSSEGAALYSCARDVPDPAQRANFFPRLGVPGLDWSLSISRLIETRLVDADTNTVVTENGQPGELRIKGPNVLATYFENPAATAAALDADGFYRTGDLFEIAGDKQQFYKFVGRTKDIVIRGGINISAAEVEGLVQAHPKVREVAVIGLPDERLGERVCAVVALNPGQTLTLPELVAHLRHESKVASYKLPEHLHIVDALPRNPMGKVVKHVLREHIQETSR